MISPLGIFFGSFDPPHNAHLDMIRKALEMVKHVEVVPAIKNPWKKKCSLNFFERTFLLERLLEDQFEDEERARVKVLPNEILHIQEGEKSLTTASFLSREGHLPAETIIFWGADILKKIHSFDDPGNAISSFNNVFFRRVAGSASSTEIRELAATGQWGEITGRKLMSSRMLEFFKIVANRRPV